MFPNGDARFDVQWVTLTSGYRVRVVTCGDRAAASVVCCLHGWACSAYTFHPLMPAVAAQGGYAVAIELLGHGMSDKPNTAAVYTLDALTRSVIEVLDALKVGQVVLVGHSMGGAIAAQIAERFADRVRALVLVAPVGFGSPMPLRMAILLTPWLITPVLPSRVPRWVVWFVLRWVYGTIRPPSRQDVDGYWAPTRLPGFVRAMRMVLHCFDWGMGRRPQQAARFARITAPTVIIYGGHDRLAAANTARQYALAIPGAQIRFLADSGHVIPNEAPEALEATVLDLLKTQ